MIDSTEEKLLDGRKLLLGVTGSIAAYKAAEVVRLFKKAGAEVQVVMTPDAARFITPLTLGTLSEREVLVEIFPEKAGSAEGGGVGRNMSRSASGPTSSWWLRRRRRRWQRWRMASAIRC